MNKMNSDLRREIVTYLSKDKFSINMLDNIERWEREGNTKMIEYADSILRARLELRTLLFKLTRELDERE